MPSYRHRRPLAGSAISSYLRHRLSVRGPLIETVSTFLVRGADLRRGRLR
jgi:hypothetical protein